MAQKLNSTNLRLKKRLNWNVIFSTQNFNDFSNIMSNTHKIILTNSKIVRKLNVAQANQTVVRTSKNYQSNYKFLDKRFFFSFFKTLIVSNRSIQKFHQYKKRYFHIFKMIFKMFFLNQNQVLNKTSSFESQGQFKNLAREMPLFMSPTIITEFSKIQMSETNPITFFKNNFAANFQSKLLNYIITYLNEFKHDIIGLKIICAGKWKKTKTGRKQKLYLKYGRIQNSNISNKIIFHQVNETTKYGVCSIKIWISHN